MVAKIDLNILTNRNIKFENKKGKWLTYQIGKGKPIRLNIKELISQVKPDGRDGITGLYAFTYYGNRDPSDEQLKLELGLGIKYLILERNLYVINSIIDEKNKKIQTLWMKILHFIVKIFTCGRVNLIEKKKLKHIKPSLSYPYPNPALPDNIRDFGWEFYEKVKKVREDSPIRAPYIKLLKGVDRQKELHQEVQAAQAYVMKGGPLEEYIEINHLSLDPSWSLAELYQMDTTNSGYGNAGKHWINGHQLDNK